MTNRILLLVEDELTLRMSMARGLAKLEGIEVAEAGTAREAKALLVRKPPALVISDLDLPDGSGIEIASELDRLGLRAPIVFVSAFVGRFRSRIPTRADVEVWEKPVSLERLRALVEDKLGVGDDAAPSPFGVADYVQLAGMGRHSVVIEVRGPSSRGKVTIHRGELWSAVDRLGKGLEAFRRLAFLKAAQVTCKTLAHADLPERDIDGAAESVLLDAARAFDEHERTSSVTNEIGVESGLDDDWEAAFSEAPATKTSAKTTARSFEDAYDRGVDALLHKDHAAAYAAFVEASRFSPEDRRVVANLSRLRAMGYS